MAHQLDMMGDVQYGLDYSQTQLLVTDLIILHKRGEIFDHVGMVQLLEEATSYTTGLHFVRYL